MIYMTLEGEIAFSDSSGFHLSEPYRFLGQFNAQMLLSNQSSLADNPKAERMVKLESLSSHQPVDLFSMSDGGKSNRTLTTRSSECGQTYDDNARIWVICPESVH